MRQALGNLVDNALRHGSGTVVLSARPTGGGSSLEIAVSDEGPGLSEELAPRAFERFTRGDAARTRGGAGLGLAIVSAIAEAHGGRAALDGRAVVRLSLPVSAG
jgi:signal transduction histidine kinase